ncbi:hypothetical protein Tco_0775898 [Tanacetum coccineum]
MGAPTSLKKWKDKFFLIDRRAAPIAMSWRHHDSSVADVLPSPSEYNAADVATLLEVPILLHKPYNSLLFLTMAEFLRLPNLGACKIVAGALLPPNFPVDNHLTNPAVRPEDIPAKTPAMEKAEVACPKVITAREKKKQRAEELLASRVVGGSKVGPKRRAGQEGTSRKKKKTVDAGPVNSEPVSSPHPLHQAPPHRPSVVPPVQEPVVAARLDVLRDQTDEPFNSGHVQSFAHDDGDTNPGDDGRGGEEQHDDQVAQDVAMQEGRGQNDDQGCSSKSSCSPRLEGEQIVTLPEKVIASLWWHLMPKFPRLLSPFPIFTSDALRREQGFKLKIAELGNREKGF